MKKLRCKRCDHTWMPRTEKKPKCCPGCKTYKWSEKPKRKNNEEVE